MNNFASRKAGAFTLLELIVVMVIMTILVAVLAPALNGSAPRKAAILQLKGALETARSEAIRRRTEVYVAFANGDLALDPDARFRKYVAYYRERPSSGGTDGNEAYDRYLSDQLDCPVEELIPISGSNELPQGVLFAMITDPTTGPDLEIRDGERQVYTILDNTVDEAGTLGNPGRLFPHPEGGARAPIELNFFMFNEDGRLQFPQFFASEYHYVGVVEGFYDEASKERVITSKRPGLQGSGEFPLSEVLSINLYSGRVRLLSESP